MCAYSSGSRSHSICHLLSTVVTYDRKAIAYLLSSCSLFLLVWKITFSITRYHYLHHLIGITETKKWLILFPFRVLFVFSRYDVFLKIVTHLPYLSHLYSKLISMYSCFTLPNLCHAENICSIEIKAYV
jgi:hypothetical protein